MFFQFRIRDSYGGIEVVQKTDPSRLVNQYNNEDSHNNTILSS
jgi:hypothetical protein